LEAARAAAAALDRGDVAQVRQYLTHVQSLLEELSAAAKPPARSGARSTWRRRTSGRVLVLEDEPLLVRAYASLLGRGFQVDVRGMAEASSGDWGVYDVVVTDHFPELPEILERLDLQAPPAGAHVVVVTSADVDALPDIVQRRALRRPVGGRHLLDLVAALVSGTPAWNVVRSATLER
jgi:hypothetical protein